MIKLNTIVEEMALVDAALEQMLKRKRLNQAALQTLKARFNSTMPELPKIIQYVADNSLHRTKAAAKLKTSIVFITSILNKLTKLSKRVNHIRLG